MEMEDNDLKEYYQSLLRKNPPHKKGCPDIEALTRSFSEEMSENEKIRVIDHISACGLCYKKFETISQILKESKTLKDQFEGVSLSETEVRELKQRAQNRINEIKAHDVSRLKLSFGQKIAALFKLKSPLKYATAIAAVFIMAVAVLILLKIPQSIKEETLRGIKKESIKMISPRGEVKEFPLTFEWEPFAGSREYQIVLLDDELTRIWTSEKVDRTKMPIPSEVQNRLQVEKTHYWKVVILLQDGTQRESDLQEFTLTKNPPFPD